MVNPKPEITLGMLKVEMFKVHNTHIHVPVQKSQT